MSAMQALGVQSWRADEWWTFLLPTDSGDVGFLITFAGVIQASIFYLRRKMVWRVKALEGSADVMPLALPKLVIGEYGEPVEAKPATLRWRLTAYGRRVWLVPWGLLGALSIAGGGAGLAIQIVFINPWLAPSDPLDIISYAAGSAFIIAGFAIWVMAARQGLRGPDGVSADSAGIARWTRRGPGETILWGDARLLEANWMAGARGQPWPQIRVYRADGASIGWPIFPAPQPGEERAIRAVGDERERGR